MVALKDLDTFGETVNFTIDRRSYYVTKLGAISTLVYFGLIALSLIYYVGKWLDKSNPFVSTTDYVGATYLDTDLKQNDYEIYISIYNLSTGEFLYGDKFWENYYLVTSLNKWGKGENNQFNIPGVSFNNLKLRACNEDLVKNLPESLKGGIYLKESWCIDDPKLHLYGGVTYDSQFMRISLLPCQPSSTITCNPNPTSPENIYVEVGAIEKTIKLDDYENPVKYTHTLLNTLLLGEGLKEWLRVELFEQTLFTDVG